jgi:NAD-dependent deacetylase
MAPRREQPAAVSCKHDAERRLAPGPAAPFHERPVPRYIALMKEHLLRAAAERVAERLAGRKRILFITGAGLSAESGLPTYRGIGGLYESEHTEHGVPIEVALSGPMFQRRPELTWHHIARLEQVVRGAKPNRAHALIAELEAQHEVVVLTQNVDGFHRAAGSTSVIDIHGDCHLLYCTACNFRERREDYAGMQVPPTCPKCGALIRPEVVLFEEALPDVQVARLEAELRQGFDAVFSIGTTSLFPYIAGPVMQAVRDRRLSVEINPDRTAVSDLVEVKLTCGASDGLSAIFEYAKKH